MRPLTVVAMSETTTPVSIHTVPQPTDWHLVPDHVDIPPGLPVWEICDDSTMVFHPLGDALGLSAGGMRRVRASAWLTKEPLIGPATRPPRPADSPILATHPGRGGWADTLFVYLAAGDQTGWFQASEQGACDVEPAWYSDGASFTNWCPVRVLPTGLGVLDDRNLDDRVDVDGNRWYWDDERGVWSCFDEAFGMGVGDLATLHAHAGPLRFAHGGDNITHIDSDSDPGDIEDPDDSDDDTDWW